MKVIGKRKTDDEVYPKRIECECCNSELEYIKDDVKYGCFGVPYIVCPVCDSEIDLYEEDGIDITPNTIEFPKYFAHTNSDTAVSMNDNTINKYIETCIDTLRKEDVTAVLTGSGDTMVFVYRFDGDEEYVVYVAKDYFELPVQFEREDYK